MIKKSQSIKSWVPSPESVQEQYLWITQSIKEIGSDTLIALAQQAASQRNFSYSPYSGYKVGAAVLTDVGKIYLGSNIERASYSETNHSEESVMASAINDGAAQNNRRFIKVVAVSHAGDTAPCGRCRQIMAEHADNCLIITANTKGEINRITSLKILLPYAFTLHRFRDQIA